MTQIDFSAVPQPLVVAGNDLVQRANDAAFPFAQDAHFFFLTRIDAPGWRVMVVDDRAILIAPEVDATHELFDGSLSQDDARKTSGINEIISRQEFEARLHGLAQKRATVYSLDAHPHEDHFDFHENPARGQLWSELQVVFKEVKDARKALSRLRALKTPAAIDSTEKAVEVTVQALTQLRDDLANYRHEYELEAFLNSEFRRTGAQGHAYDPIVAGGKNACTLHYVRNNDELPKNGLVLLDVGAKVDGYAADITRTYAIGTPTERQVAVHAAVEKAHHAIIELIAPGVSLKHYLDRSDEIMKEALRSLDLLSSEEDYRRYFPHAISHGLGLDVHESLGGHETFQPGMVLTVEPGIYIPEEEIGVRIEDDILVTADGHRNLSAGLSTRL